MISYAQNYEDVLLARAFPGRDRGFYIDIGAWHPVADSVTKHFYDLGWNGINIEPAEEYFTLLERERPKDVNLRIAVGARRETRRFYRFAGSGLSTFSEEHLGAYSVLGLRPEETDVEIVPLREVCERHVHGTIDFLKIDVEGWEREVILGGDWERYRPRIVLVEAVAPNPQAFLSTSSDGPALPEPAWESWEGLLSGNGYELCYFDGLNRFYVRQEDRGLRDAFQFPPNVYDRFESRQSVELRTALDDLTAAHTEIVERLTGELARFQGRCGDLERLQDDLSARAAQAESELQRLARELRQGEERMEALTRDLAALRQERAGLEARLQAVLSSQSWRWTGPLRGLARRLRPR